MSYLILLNTSVSSYSLCNLWVLCFSILWVSIWCYMLLCVISWIITLEHCYGSIIQCRFCLWLGLHVQLPCSISISPRSLTQFLGKRRIHYCKLLGWFTLMAFLFKHSFSFTNSLDICQNTTITTKFSQKGSYSNRKPWPSWNRDDSREAPN